MPLPALKQTREISGTSLVRLDRLGVPMDLSVRRAGLRMRTESSFPNERHTITGNPEAEEREHMEKSQTWKKERK